MARTPIHPGEILGNELEEIGLSAAELSRTLRVPPNRISQLIAGKRAITADTALRLAQYFGTSADLWMNLQKTYELDLARKEAGEEIKSIPDGSPRAARLPLPSALRADWPMASLTGPENRAFERVPGVGAHPA